MQVAAGVIGQPPVDSDRAFQFNVTAQGRLITPEEFEKIIVKTGEDGRVVYLGEVARVGLGAQDYVVNSYLDGKPAVAMAIQQRPGSNALGTAERVKERMSELSADFPQGIEYRVIYNPTVFIEESVRAVIHTIFEAALLVVVVVMVFLQSWRASLIRIVAIPISLIGTFAVMAALGFSLIISRCLGSCSPSELWSTTPSWWSKTSSAISPKVWHHGKRQSRRWKKWPARSSPLRSAERSIHPDGLHQRNFWTVLSPVCAHHRSGDALFRLRLADISPAFCRVLLQPHGAKRDWFARMSDFTLGWFFRLFNRSFTAASTGYGRLVSVVTRRTAIVLILYIGLLALTVFGFIKVPAGFIPAQDQGYLITVAQLPRALRFREPIWWFAGSPRSPGR